MLGCFLDASTIILVVLPLFIPTCRALGIDLVHFGVISVVNIMIGLITPPYGILLFVINGATGIPIGDMVRNIVPFLIALLLALAAITFVPELVLWLPRQYGYVPGWGDSDDDASPRPHRRQHQDFKGTTVASPVRASITAVFEVSYDLFVPPDLGGDFDTILNRCHGGGLIRVDIHPSLQGTGSRQGGDRGPGDPPHRRHQHRAVRDQLSSWLQHRLHRLHRRFPRRLRRHAARTGGTGSGAGGVGRAIAYALLELGAEAISIVDTDQGKAERLAAALRDEGRDTAVIVTSLEAAIAAADGVVNATPIGMVGYPARLVAGGFILDGRRWVFDAVYTQIETALLRDAAARGVRTLSGYELFLHQGIDAFRNTGSEPPELAMLRGGGGGGGGGERLHMERGGDIETDRRWHPNEALRRQRAQLRERPGILGEAGDPVTDRDLVDASTDGNDGARQFDAGDQRVSLGMRDNIPRRIIVSAKLRPP